jgi:hypothetical protein
MIASEADLPLIVELGREAHEGSAWVGLASFDAESFERSCRALMLDPEGLVLIGDRGSIWLKRFPLYFNHAERVAHEVFYYATRNGRALREAAEAWADGALITMSRNAGTREALEESYRRAGYVPIEHTFIRRA